MHNKSRHINAGECGLTLCQRMKRLSITILGSALIGCAQFPKPIPDDVNGKRLARMTYIAQEDELTPRAIHDVLFAAYSRTRDKLMGGEDLEAIHLNLRDLRTRLGDERFADALKQEDPAVVSAIRWYLDSDTGGSAYPRTDDLLSGHPARGYELQAAYKNE